MTAVVLALDLGTTTGWACQAADGTIVHGWSSFKPGRYEGGGMRYLRFKKWLAEIYGSVGPEISSIYFEEVRRHASTDSAHVYGGLLATLTAWCEQNNIPCEGVPVGTIKKHATVRSNADKQAMVAAMHALGHPVTDDNEADALALLHWALEADK